MAQDKQPTGLLTPPSDPPITSAVLHRSLHEQPLQVIHSNGIYLHLSNGQTILDATGGAAVACLGHNHAAIQAAMVEQIHAVSYCHSLFYSTPPAEELCRLLIDSTEGKMNRAFIVSSGSEAMEAAIKIARQYFLEKEPPEPDRVRFIARKQSYHGTTMGSLGMGGHVARRKLYEPLLTGNVSHVSPCFAYRGMTGEESVAEYVDRLAEELDQEFQRVGAETVCAFVAEPVVGAALGCVPSVPGYFEAVKQVCDRYGALLVLDEVMSGMGRCGTMHAWQHPDVNVVPDIQTVGKGLGGGYAPVAGMLVGPRVISVLEKGSGAFSHGQTYQGHPLACAAAAAVQKEIQKPGVLARVRDLGQRLERGLRDGLGNHPFVGDIRGRGLFWGIEFVQDKKRKTPFDPVAQVAMGVHSLGMRDPNSISIYPGTGTVDGVRGDHVLICPPYTCTDEEIDLIVRKSVEVVRGYFSTHPELSPRLDGGNSEDHNVSELYKAEDGTLLASG